MPNVSKGNDTGYINYSNAFQLVRFAGH